MKRHKDLTGQVQAKLEGNTEKLGRSVKWKELAVNRIVVGHDKDRDYIFNDCSRRVLRPQSVFVYDTRSAGVQERT